MIEKTNWYNISWEESIKLLKSDGIKGLDNNEVKIRQEKFGKNKLPTSKTLPQFKIFLEQFQSPMVYILLLAGIITFLLKEYTDAIVIFSAVFLNTVIGYIQESKSSKALKELRKVLSLKAIVFRNGQQEEILADDLVLGDIMVLRPGDKVPADGRLIEAQNLKINEAALTGEWLSASKNTDILSDDTPLADRDNMVYMGTIIEDGLAKAIVTATGIKTEIGKITSLVKETKEAKTPYQKKLIHFSKVIGIIISIICIIIFVEGILTGGKFIEIFTTAVAVAVSAIPEGLPMAMTVILALGMQKILKRKGLVRKLSAAETLGSTSVIATDKTGTLTKGLMTVAGIFTLSSNKKEEEEILKNIVLCSEAFIENPQAKPEDFIAKGMFTERALVLAGAQAGFFKDKLEIMEPQLDEIIFNSKDKYSASLRKLSDQENIIYTKGAPEIILAKSKNLKQNNEDIEMTAKDRDLLNKKYEELASQGYRILGVAYRKLNEKLSRDIKLEAEINDLVFQGFVFLEDPIRIEARDAITSCYQAGMKPIIITGDHRLTAKAIANKLGFNVKDENILEGKDLEKISETELNKILRNIQIYARVEPKHKLRIIKAWQKKGEVVAMTGDGINDAPALKQADIGVALGSGTEVAKEVSDLVLLSDDFSIIVSAVEEGRAILDNIRKVITYLLSDSFSEIILIGISLLAGFPLPITAVQILWINLIEDGFPNIALAFEPKEKDLMKQKPQSRQVPLLTKEMKIIIFIVGIVTDLFLLAIFFWLNKQNYVIEYTRTIIFACLAIDSIFYVFSCKSLRKNIWHINLFNNKLLLGACLFSVLGLLTAIYLPVFNKLLGTVALPLSAWYIIGAVAIVNIFLIELAKYSFITRHKTEE
ncbi:MAG TPA: HAD-IC family P-type ATPase [bacterium]|nr:HAD-IC family P-type ATPase [bacterium]